jgi:hypothetical protein
MDDLMKAAPRPSGVPRIVPLLSKNAAIFNGCPEM